MTLRIKETLSTGRGSSRSHYVEKLFWKRMWKSRKTEKRMMMFTFNFYWEFTVYGVLTEMSGHLSPKHISFWSSAEHEIEIQTKF
jgi:hypothetical protein